MASESPPPEVPDSESGSKPDGNGDLKFLPPPETETSPDGLTQVEAHWVKTEPSSGVTPQIVKASP